MSRVILFNSPIIFKGSPDVFETTPSFIRYGIASIAGYLRKKGIGVEVLDPRFISTAEVKRRIDEFSPEFAGISSFSNEIDNVARTMEYVKGIDPKIKTVIGHCHVSALPVETMRSFKSFDLAVLGEGEVAMSEIASGKSPQEISGLAYRKEGKVIVNKTREPVRDLSLLGMPAFDLYDLNRYREKALFLGGRVLNLPVETSRGCPFSCLFCFRTIGKEMRYKEPGQVADELNYYIEKYPVARIAFIDGTFGINKKMTMELCREIINRKIDRKIKWNASVRANNLDEEMIEIFARSGCRVLGLGVESGDNRVLDSCAKGITTQDILRTVKLCKKYNIFVEAYFIFGLPGDNRETIENTIRFAVGLDIAGANFAILVPFPGTQVFEWAKRQEMGYSLATLDYSLFGKQIGCALKNQNIDGDALLGLQTKAYKVFYTSNPKRFMQFLYHLNAKRLLGVARRFSSYRYDRDY